MPQNSKVPKGLERSTLLDNSCGGVALSQNNYRDFEFNGTFQRQDKDDDSIGFVFGYEDPGHFYLIIASGDWSTHGKYFKKIL